MKPSTPQSAAAAYGWRPTVATTVPTRSLARADNNSNSKKPREQGPEAGRMTSVCKPSEWRELPGIPEQSLLGPRLESWTSSRALSRSSSWWSYADLLGVVRK